MRWQGTRVQQSRGDAATVVVTGAGGGVGQSIIKALAGSDVEVVAVDADPLAAGLYATPRSAVVPRASDPSYADALLDVCLRVGAVAVLPGLDPELPVLAEAVARFAAAGVRVVVSTPDVVRLCDDKLATADLLAQGGFAAPETRAFTEDVDASWFPFVVKPRRGGSRSIGVHLVRGPEDWDRVRPLVDPANTVIQEYVDGDELTCGSVSLDGKCRGVIAMRRTLRAGDTFRAEVVRDDALEAEVTEVVDRVGPEGACNVQLRVRDGRPHVFEVNPRCSGTTAARALAGFNEPLMVLRWHLAGEEPAYEIRDLAVVRYWQELVVDPARRHDMEAGAVASGRPVPL